MGKHHSQYMQGSDIVPVRWKSGSSITDIIDSFGKTCFEARKTAHAARLFEQMIKSSTIWLGVSGAGPAGGMGGYIIDLIENGFVDVICSTGAQVYHDGHFAFGLPVVQGCPNVDDNALDKDGTTRIYDIYIRMKETLEAQDEIICDFIRKIGPAKCSSADFCNSLGRYILDTAQKPELSWVGAAAKYGVPIFLDSESNHSLGMNVAKVAREGIEVIIDPSQSLNEGAAIVYCHPQLGYFEWGGGGPKNWIQTLAPMISQILGIDFEGADRGIQVTTAPEHDGGLSGCTFGEAVTWGKYKDATSGLIQIRQEYSTIVPLLVGYVVDNCQPREHRRFMDHKQEFLQRLNAARKE